jgi:hypothetical protein
MMNKRIVAASNEPFEEGISAAPKAEAILAARRVLTPCLPNTRLRGRSTHCVGRRRTERVGIRRR